MQMMRFSNKAPVACLVALGWVGLSWIGAGAHPVRGVTDPLATAFVGSPTAGTDLPIPVAWGTEPNRFDSGVSVACFHVANTTQLPGSDWPRLTAVGFELPGTRSGFKLLTPQNQGWQVVENIAIETPRGALTIDFALVAPVNPMGHSTVGNPHELLGLPPNQPTGRGNGTPLCVAGPFPPGFSIEQIIDGVVVRFHRVEPRGPSTDFGLWDNAARAVPLYP